VRASFKGRDDRLHRVRPPTINHSRFPTPEHASNTENPPPRYACCDARTVPRVPTIAALRACTGASRHCRLRFARVTKNTTDFGFRLAATPWQLPSMSTLSRHFNTKSVDRPRRGREGSHFSLPGAVRSRGGGEMLGLLNESGRRGSSGLCTAGEARAQNPAGTHTLTRCASTTPALARPATSPALRVRRGDAHSSIMCYMTSLPQILTRTDAFHSNKRQPQWAGE